MGMWGAVLGSGVGLLGNIIGGAQRRGAIKRAGTVLEQTAGREAQNALELPETINPMIGEAYQQAGTNLSTVANRSGDTVEQRAAQAAAAATGAGAQANEYLDPYRTAGSNALTTLSQLAQSPAGVGDLTMDPGYQFRIQQGQQALERAAAARGSLQGGGTLKALTRYAQGEASQEYQNAFQRAMAQRAQQTGTLSSLASMGSNAAGQMGQNLIGTSEYGGTLGTNAAGTAGSWRNQAAQQQGQWGIQSAGAQAGNLIDAANQARQLRLQGQQAVANSIMGAGQATSDMWGGAGQAIGSGITLGSLMRGGGAGGGGWGSGGWGWGRGSPYGPAGAPPEPWGYG